VKKLQVRRTTEPNDTAAKYLNLPYFILQQDQDWHTPLAFDRSVPDYCEGFQNKYE
jgi:hypothetical protein